MYRTYLNPIFLKYYFHGLKSTRQHLISIGYYTYVNGTYQKLVHSTVIIIIGSTLTIPFACF